MKFYDGLLGHDPDQYFNSRGHRCKELENLNFHNYFLFAGDNVALDYSKPIEETYPHIISEKCRVDYYNISIFNGGLDALRCNLISWFLLFKEKPRAIIISNEFTNSLLGSNSNTDSISVLDHGIEEVKSFSYHANLNGFFNARQEFTDRQITLIVNSPLYQINLPNKISAFKNVRDIHNLDWQGDLYDHNGIAKLFCDYYINNKRKIAP